jgi:hypothetical protein
MRQPILKGARIGLGTCAIAFGAALWPAQAPAQFGTIFGGDPPRPPADVPSRPPANLPPQQPPPPVQARPPAPQQQAPRGAGVQSQPLPPPPGAPAVPLDRAQTAAPPSPTPGLPPGQRQPRGAPQQAALPAPEEPAEPATPKIPNNSAVFSGLDKITGRIISFDVALNETVQFGALQVTPRACYTRPPTELPLTDGFVEVAEVTLQGEVRRIFTGWMFAASPGLHGVEHSIYDVWLTDCKEPQVAKVAEEAAPAPPPQRQQPRQGAAPRANPNPSLRPAQPPASAPRGTLANPR